MKTSSIHVLVVLAVLPLAACGGDVLDLDVGDAVINRQACDGAFFASVDIANPTGDRIGGQVDVLDRENIARGLSTVPAGPTTFPANSSTPVVFDGSLADSCDDGRIGYQISGTGRGTPAADVLLTSVIAGENAPGDAGADPGTGRFSYDLTYGCCGVGFANPYDLEAIDQDNTTDLAVDPATFMCVGTERRTVTVSGRLRDTSKDGLVRVRIEDRARDVSCTLDEEVVRLSEEGG